MNSEKPKDLERWERDIREALASSSPERTPECLEPSEMLDLIEAAGTVEHLPAAAHVARCPWCRKHYVAFRAAFAKADQLRLAEPPTPGDTPDATNASSGQKKIQRSTGTPRSRAPLYWFAPRLRYAFAAVAVALFGFYLGRWQTSTSRQVVQVTERPASSADKQIQTGVTEAQRLKDENARLRRQLASLDEAITSTPTSTTIRPVPAQSTRKRDSRPTGLPTRIASAVVPVIRDASTLAAVSISRRSLSELEVRGDDGLEGALLEPGRTWLMTDLPRFRCRFPGATGETRYIVRLIASSEEVLSVEQTGDSFEWRPAYRIPRGQTLRWTVTATVGESEYSAGSTFGILTDDEVDRLQKSLEGSTGLSRARIYKTAGLLDNAKTVLERIPATSPEHTAAVQELSQIRDLTAPQRIPGSPQDSQTLHDDPVY